MDRICDIIGINIKDLFDDRKVEFNVEILPGDLELLQIMHTIDADKRHWLIAYAEGLRDGKKQ